MTESEQKPINLSQILEELFLQWQQTDTLLIVHYFLQGITPRILILWSQTIAHRFVENTNPALCCLALLNGKA